MPVLQKKRPNYKYTHSLSLFCSSFRDKGLSPQFWDRGRTVKRSVSATLLIGCATRATRMADPTVQPTYHQPSAAPGRADPNGRPQQQPIFPPPPRRRIQQTEFRQADSLPLSAGCTVQCGGRGRDILGILRLGLFWVCLGCEETGQRSELIAPCERWQLAKGGCRSWVGRTGNRTSKSEHEKYPAIVSCGNNT